MTMPKNEWGDGPWQKEPDHIAWYDDVTGYPCLLIRDMVGSGAWRGYVVVPPQHPAHGKRRDELPIKNLNVHGGVTYTGFARRIDGYVPRPGEPGDVFCIGFDAAHAFDIMPLIKALLGNTKPDPALRAVEDKRDAAAVEAGINLDLLAASYKTSEYMRMECCDLAAQLKALH